MVSEWAATAEKQIDSTKVRIQHSRQVILLEFVVRKGVIEEKSTDTNLEDSTTRLGTKEAKTSHEAYLTPGYKREDKFKE